MEPTKVHYKISWARIKIIITAWGTGWDWELSAAGWVITPLEAGRTGQIDCRGRKDWSNVLQELAGFVKIFV